MFRPLLTRFKYLVGVKNGNGHFCTTHDIKKHIRASITLISLGEKEMRLINKGNINLFHWF